MEPNDTNSINQVPPGKAVAKLLLPQQRDTKLLSTSVDEFARIGREYDAVFSIPQVDESLLNISKMASQFHDQLTWANDMANSVVTNITQQIDEIASDQLAFKPPILDEAYMAFKCMEESLSTHSDLMAKLSDAIPKMEPYEGLTIYPASSLAADLDTALNVQLANNSPSPIWDLSWQPELYESDPIPPPIGGTLSQILTIRKGTVQQVSNVLDEEFCEQHDPVLYLIRHYDLFYWHIEIFEGEESQSQQLKDIIAHGEFGKANKAFLELQRKQKRIGYIHLSDRPLIPVRFFVFEGAYNDVVKELAQRVSTELENWQFETINQATEQPKITTDTPPPVTIWDKFTPVHIKCTVDELESLVKSCLFAMGHIAESSFVQQLVDRDEGYISIQYSFEGCIIRFSVRGLEPRLLQVQPSVLCWLAAPLDRQTSREKTEPHVKTMLESLKANSSWQPEKPLQTDNLDDWFIYYHECKQSGIKYTLQDLAKDVSRTYGYVRQLHSEYQAENKI